MGRYITVIKKYNNGVKRYPGGELIECKPDYDVVRWDTEENEYVYGNDKMYLIENFNTDIKPINIFSYMNYDEESKLKDELIKASKGKTVNDYIRLFHENTGYIVLDRLNQVQKEIFNKYLNRVNSKRKDDLIKEYDNDFSIDNKKLRKLFRESYKNGVNPTCSLYEEKDGKLYRINEGLSTELYLVHDSNYPDKIKEDLIDK